MTPLHDHADLLGMFSKALVHRTTSVLSDELICLANLLGLDSRVISEIAASDEAGRMAAFWRLTSNMPIHLLFTHYERLSNQGLQWAPASLLRRPTGIIARIALDWETKKAEITDHGLHCRMAGFALRSTWNPDTSRITMLKGTSGMWFEVRTVHHAWTIDSNGLPEKPSDSSRKLLIVFPTQFEQDSIYNCPGLLVEKLDLCSNGRHRVRFVCDVVIKLQRDMDPDMSIHDMRSMWRKVTDEESVRIGPIEIEVLIEEVEELDEDTQWCLQ
jgi:hypothetical protein